MSGETEKEILKILEVAVEREKAAQNLYGRGAKLSENPEVKSIFKKLQQEEEQHEKIIRDMYYKYKKRLGMKIFDEPPT